MPTNLSSFRRVVSLYVDGFRAMRLGKSLWLLLAIKLIVLFGIMKLFFFPDYLSTHYDTDSQRSASVLDHLTKE